MQRINVNKMSYFDPVQRSEQWKQSIKKEEKHLGLSPRSAYERPPAHPTRAGRGAGAGAAPPRLGVDGSLRSSRSALRSRGSGMGSGRRRNDMAMSTARSSLSRRSFGSRSGRRTGRSRSGRSTARSMASSRSGYSLTSSLPSSASGMTSVALARLERLEKSLDEERNRRAMAEEQLEQLRKLVDQRLMTLEKH